jgi:hypothetical protein
MPMVSLSIPAGIEDRLNLSYVASKYQFIVQRSDVMMSRPCPARILVSLRINFAMTMIEILNAKRFLLIY